MIKAPIYYFWLQLNELAHYVRTTLHSPPFGRRGDLTRTM